VPDPNETSTTTQIECSFTSSGFENASRLQRAMEGAAETLSHLHLSWKPGRVDSRTNYSSEYGRARSFRTRSDNAMSSARAVSM
jgi:hypothetical protein